MDEIRIDINEKLKREFDILYENITDEKITTEDKCNLIKVQLSIATQIIREADTGAGGKTEPDQQTEFCPQEDKAEF